MDISASTAFPVKFRNYLPYDAELQQYSILFKDISMQESKEDNSSSSSSSSSSSGVSAGGVGGGGEGRRKIPEMKKNAILQELDSLRSDEIHIVPKKANSDLKKQVEERLKKLNKRTERALVDILREKLSREAAIADE